MFKSYIRIAVRRLLLERQYVVLNTLGLSLGLASFVILVLYLRSELTYDKHYENYDRIYRIVGSMQIAGNEPDTFASTGPAMAPGLVKDFPQLGTFVRFARRPAMVLSHNGTARAWEDIFAADESVISVF